MHFLQTINSDLSVLIVCNKTGGTIKGDIKKKILTSRKFCTKDKGVLQTLDNRKALRLFEASGTDYVPTEIHV